MTERKATESKRYAMRGDPRTVVPAFVDASTGGVLAWIAHLRRRHRVLGAAGVGRLHARRRATLREHARLARLIHNLDGARGSLFGLRLGVCGLVWGLGLG